jgi:hypothetical protein
MDRSTRALRYRVCQFFAALTARIADEELKWAAHVLTLASLALFRSMAVQDQRHGLDVCAALRQAGHTNRDLLAAALLHDVGKAAARLYPWQRAIIVLLGRLAPRLLSRLGQSDDLPDYVPSPLEERTPSWPKGWRRVFIVNAHHAEVGARWAQQAGCSPQTVSLIRRHQDRPGNGSVPIDEEDQLLAALQVADDQN